MIEIEFALSESKELVHVSQVSSGLKSNSFCLHCGEKLMAKQGQVLQWHFSHLSQEGHEIFSSCTGESALHKACKKILTEVQYIQLPDMKTFYFNQVAIEHPIPRTSRRADAILYSNKDENSTLIVEFNISNRKNRTWCEEVHQAKHISMEVDIKGNPRNKSELKRIILSNADRRFLTPYNPPSEPEKFEVLNIGERGEQGECKTQGCNRNRMWKQQHGYCGWCISKIRLNRRKDLSCT